jgi:DNA-binding MarR family transcriptional regulator
MPDQPPQQEPESTFEDLGYWMSSLGSAMIRSLTRRTALYEITSAQYRILEMCFRREANTVTGLAQVVAMDQAGVSRQVDRLCNRGLLRRRRQRNDRRMVRLELTEEGRALVPELIEQAQASHTIILADINKEERDAFLATLQKMLANLAKEEQNAG